MTAMPPPPGGSGTIPGPGVPIPGGGTMRPPPSGQPAPGASYSQPPRQSNVRWLPLIVLVVCLALAIVAAIIVGGYALQLAQSATATPPAPASLGAAGLAPVAFALGIG